MIAEYALIPDGFLRRATLRHRPVTSICATLKKGLVSRGVVRNLHDGGWWDYVQRHRDLWDKRGRELLKKLKQQALR